MKSIDIIQNGLFKLGIENSDKKAVKLDKFLDILLEKNKIMNLTAITDKCEAAEKHIVDCAYIGSVCNFSGKTVIDIGCGAGFPGVPLAVCYPCAQITMLDSTGKRIDFIRDTLEKLAVSAETICGRAEDIANLPELRENFDIAVSRAVAPMNILAELCLPFVKLGGVFIAMKASACDEEIAAAEKSIKTLGGSKPEIHEYTLEISGIVRKAVVIPKIEKTPKQYPRRFSQIKKNPL